MKIKKEKDFNLLHFFFRVISRRLHFMCRHFGTPVCSIFIGLVNKKNNLDQISRVFLQVKPTPIGRRRRRVRVEEQAVEGSGRKWRPVVRQVRTGETAPCRSEVEEPWNVSDLTIVF